MLTCTCPLPPFFTCLAPIQSCRYTYVIPGGRHQKSKLGVMNWFIPNKAKRKRKKKKKTKHTNNTDKTKTNTTCIINFVYFYFPIF